MDIITQILGHIGTFTINQVGIIILLIGFIFIAFFKFLTSDAGKKFVAGDIVSIEALNIKMDKITEKIVDHLDLQKNNMKNQNDTFILLRNDLTEFSKNVLSKFEKLEENIDDGEDDSDHKIDELRNLIIKGQELMVNISFQLSTIAASLKDTTPELKSELKDLAKNVDDLQKEVQRIEMFLNAQLSNISLIKLR